MVFVYACGFNAHGQIDARSGDVQPPEDVRSLIEIGQGVDATEGRVLYTGWSSTVLLLDDTIRIHGQIKGRRSSEAPLAVRLPHGDIKQGSEIRTVCGDLNGPLALITWGGHVYDFVVSSQTELTLTLRGDATSPTISHLAIMGSGRTAIIMLQARGSRMIHILEFDDFSAFEQWYADPSATSDSEGDKKRYKHYMQGGRAVTLLAGATCFVLLTEEGEVFSWGDGRYPRCLGRIPNGQGDVSTPSLISALGGISIAKIAGCGWMFGALSTDKDLYLWGCDKPGSDLELQKLLGAGDEEVRLLDDEQFEDVSDFAIGNGHIVVTTPRRGAYTIGANGNGQLGLGSTSDAFATTWSKLAQVEHGQDITLAAGDASTFVISSHRIQD